MINSKSKEKNLKKRKSGHLDSQIKSSKNNKKLETEEEQLKNFLFEAIKNDNIEKIKLLLGNNKEKIAEIINQRVNEVTFLHLSVANNNLEISNLLLENGARPGLEDSDGDNCFHYSARRGNLRMLKLLAEYTKSKTKDAVNAHNQIG
jgi:ankyrin repeat protein